MNQLDVLKRLPVDVSLICRTNEREYVERRYGKKIDCRFYNDKLEGDAPAREMTLLWAKEVSCYRRCIRECLCNSFDYIWFGTEESALLSQGLCSIPYVFNCLEFWDRSLKKTRFIRRIAQGAFECIACEPTRAWLMKLEWGLPELPSVVPNKFEDHPRLSRIPPSTEASKKAVEVLGERAAILYQGWLRQDRGLEEIARALVQIRDDLWLTILAPETEECLDALRRLQAIYPKTIYLGYLPSPLHLELTSYASVGIARYEPTSLNNVYCAPNKIYEYAGFGIPVLCNNIPGLEETIGRAGAGVCVDFSDLNGVADALKKLVCGRNQYAKAATDFFDGTDTTVLLGAIVEKMKQGLG